MVELESKMIQNMTVLNIQHNISAILYRIHLLHTSLFTVASLVKLSVCVCVCVIGGFPYLAAKVNETNGFIDTKIKN